MPWLGHKKPSNFHLISWNPHFLMIPYGRLPLKTSPHAMRRLSHMRSNRWVSLIFSPSWACPWIPLWPGAQELSKDTHKWFQPPAIQVFPAETTPDIKRQRQDPSAMVGKILRWLPRFPHHPLIYTSCITPFLACVGKGGNCKYDGIFLPLLHNMEK